MKKQRRAHALGGAVLVAVLLAGAAEAAQRRVLAEHFTDTG